MPRLPVPGGDVDAWAAILNEYLLVTHAENGDQRIDSIGSAALQSRSIGVRHLRTTNASGATIQNQVLSNSNGELVWKPVDMVGAPPSQQMRINVADFGAKGDGVTDDTVAIQTAINAAAGGGSIEFPRGIYMVRTLKISNKGTALVGAARWGTRLVRLSGSAPLLDMSGIATGVGHLRYCSVINLMLHGNSMPGVLVRSYYADNLVFRDVNFIHSLGLATDFIEVWDTRFEACTWEHCGSTSSPALLLRNSAPVGSFGYSTDNTNQIHFIACRWEGFKNGAVRLDGGANGSPSMLNGIFFVACKMESSVVAGVPFQIMAGSTVIYVTQLYMAVMAPDAGFTGPVDAISDSGTHVFMTNVYVQWGPALGLAGSVAHVLRSGPHMYHEVGTFFPSEDPAGGMIVAEMDADTMVSCLWSNRGRRLVGDIHEMLESGPHMGLTLPLHHPASVRVVNHETGRDLVKIDSNPTRPALHTLGGVDMVGFSDNYLTEKWRIVGANGGARFAAGKFQIEGNKGYVGMNATPTANIAMLIKPAIEGDRAMAIVRPTNTATHRLLEFQDETYNIQGMAIDSHGRPVAVGTPARVAPGDQTSYANPMVQVRDIAGNVTAAVKPSPTAPGTIATITFSRPYASPPLAITINDHSPIPGDLFVSARTSNGFTVSTRAALRGGLILKFDYTITA